jgi:hypothetical protein
MLFNRKKKLTDIAATLIPLNQRLAAFCKEAEDKIEKQELEVVQLNDRIAHIKAEAVALGEEIGRAMEAQKTINALLRQI